MGDCLQIDSAAVKPETKSKNPVVSAVSTVVMADITQAQLDGIKEARTRHKLACARLKQELDDLKATVARLAEEKSDLNKRLMENFPDQQRRFGNKVVDNRSDLAAIYKTQAAERITAKAELDGGNSSDTSPDETIVDGGDTALITAEEITEDGEVEELDAMMGVSLSDLIIRFNGILRIPRI